MKTKTAHGRSPPTEGAKASVPTNAHRAIIIQQILKIKIMKTTVIESNKAGYRVNSSAVNAKAENNGARPKTNVLPLSKSFDDKPKGEPEAKKTETTAKAKQAKQQDALKAETVQPQAEQEKPEAPKAEAEQPKAESVKEVKVEAHKK